VIDLCYVTLNLLYALLKSMAFPIMYFILYVIDLIGDLQAWRCAPEDSGQVQLPSSPRGYHTLCKISVHLNQPLTLLHLNRTHIAKIPRGQRGIFTFSLFTLHFSLTLRDFWQSNK